MGSTVVHYGPHAIILANLAGQKPGFRPGFQQVHVGFWPVFNFFGSKPGHEPTASVSTCPEWCSRFVCTLDRWNVEKPVSRQPTNLLKLDFCYLFHYSCLSWCYSCHSKNAMEKLDFTSENVIFCVHNEHALRDTECRSTKSILKYYMYQLVSLSSSSRIRVLCTPYLCLSVIHVERFRLFLAANIVVAPKLQITSAVQATTMASVSCPPYCKREVGVLGHVTHVTGEITRS